MSSGDASLSGNSGTLVTLILDEPAQNQTVTLSDGQLSDSASVDIRHSTNGGGDGEYDYVYPDGIGSYIAGKTIVLGSDGDRYRCRPFPQGGWCNIDSPYHYAPGTGANWQDAWIRL